MSILKRKSSIALIVGIVIVLLLIPIWYVMLAPSIMTSEIENIDATTSYEGRITGQVVKDYYDVLELPIQIEAHAYVEDLEGDNIILRVDTAIMNMTDPDEPNKLEEFCSNSTYVVNKYTRENIWDAPQADKNRTGYFDPLYPTYLKEGQDITNVWLDTLNITSTLEFKESLVEDGITLYKYFVNETIVKELNLAPTFKPGTNFTMSYTKTVLIEPLSGLLTYTEDETFRLWWTPTPPSPPKSGLMKLVYPLTYKNTAESKIEGLETAKMAYDGIQLLELYIPTVLGAIAIILIVGLVFNMRRLIRGAASQARKSSP